MTTTFHSHSASWSLSELPTWLPLPAANTTVPELPTVKPLLIPTGRHRAQSPQHSCPSDVCQVISGARQATLNSSPSDNPAEKDEDEAQRDEVLSIYLFCADGAAEWKLVKNTHMNQIVGERSQKSLGVWLRVLGWRSVMLKCDDRVSSDINRWASRGGKWDLTSF